MARKKKTDDATATTDATTEGTPRAVVQRKTAFQWGELLTQMAKDKWREIRVTIRVRDRLLGGKPRELDAAKAMLAARGLEDQIEAIPEEPTARAAVAARVEQEGVCEFHRRPGKDGMWLPTNNIKAGLKENWSVLGFRAEHRGTRKAIHEGVFVYSDVPADADPIERDYIFLGENPDGVLTAPSHSEIRGETFTSIKRNEFLNRPTITFIVRIASELADKIPDDAFAKMMLHYAEHGLGASRSQGHGKFDIVSIEDIGIVETEAA